MTTSTALTATFLSRPATLLLAVLAVGCASQRAHDAGNELITQGQTREGLAKLQEASQLEPRNAEYRLSYINAREHDALQTDSQRLGAVDSRDMESAKPSQAEAALAAVYRKPISLEFRDAPLKTVVDVMARSSGLNILFDKDVRADARTTIHLGSSTVEHAIKMLCLIHQLEQRVIDANTVLFYPNTPAKRKDHQPLIVRSFYLSNASAKDVANTLKSILKTRDVVVDENLNLMIVRDSAAAIQLAEKLVALHDVPEPEVMLEVEILEIKRGRLVDLGVRWPDQATLTPLPTSSGGTLTLESLKNLNRSTIGVSVTPATLSASQQNSDTNVLANPRIRARNREKANILIGERVPNITTTATSTGFLSESVSYVDVGLKLNVQPTIYPNNDVAIDVSLEVSNIVSQLQTKSGSVAYQIGTRTASTVLRLRDGENQVLAGLINDEDRRSSNGVPLLSRLPLLGRLFGAHSNNRSKTEIVLSITPRVVRGLQRPGPEMIRFDSGTEASLASTSGSNEASAGHAPTTAAAAAAAAQLNWLAPTDVTVGETFAVQLLMRSDRPVFSLPLAISFDPRVFQITSITEGDYLTQNGAQTSFQSAVEAGGRANVTATRDGDTGATDPGVIATFTFRAIAAAESGSAIQLPAISAFGEGGRSINVPTPAAHLINVATRP